LDAEDMHASSRVPRVVVRPSPGAEESRVLGKLSGMTAETEDRLDRLFEAACGGNNDNM